MLRRIAFVGLVFAALLQIGCRTGIGINQPLNFGGSSQMAVASAHPVATQAGIDVLEQGGNAFDAAVAVAAALAVVEPYGSGMGGGGYWLLREANGEMLVVDAREQAPLASTADMYLDAAGNFDRKRSTVGPLAAGIPGQAAAFDYIAKNYGNLSLKRSLEPAIAAAEQFQIDQRFADSIANSYEKLKGFQSTAAVLLENGALPEKGFELKQTALAETLTMLAQGGHQAFYDSAFTEKLVNDVQAAGGIWTREDFRQYQLKFYQPLVGEFNGAKVYTVPPSSSGGVVMLQALNLLESWNYQEQPEQYKQQMIIEALRHSYRNRALYLGDPEFSSIPVEQLISKAYAEQYGQSFKLGQPTAISNVAVDMPAGENTTHLSVVDKDGNMVSATLSINTRFGSGYLSPSSGIILNNEMDDFSAKVGTQNSYGLTAESNANSIAPLKRPLSSMSPTMFETDEQIGVIGTPGGSRIISMVMLGIINALEGGDVDDWVEAPRYHHQYQPDIVQVEPELLDEDWVLALKDAGYSIKSVGREYGNMQVISLNKRNDRLSAASDPRGVGEAIVKSEQSSSQPRVSIGFGWIF